MNIQMVNLKDQYLNIKAEIDSAIQKVLDKTDFICGEKVFEFANNLSNYVGSKHCVTCANGTDALQIALMSIDAKPGDEVIVPSFTYIATVEVIALLKLVPVLVDVNYNSFTINTDLIEKNITKKTKAIIPVHLFGQSADMEKILQLADKYNLYVIEDNAQAIGALYKFSNGLKKKTGSLGHIGCTSFYPSKNLGCYGDGGALFTDDDMIYEKLKMISNHGQIKKYYHSIVGCNSRLDTLQAAVLDVKLKYLDSYNLKRLEAAHFYTKNLITVEEIVVPEEMDYSTHVYHQYTIKVQNDKRDQLQKYLEGLNIPSMVYYPVSLEEQKAFVGIALKRDNLDNSKLLANSVLSLPMHSELTEKQQNYVIRGIKTFFS